MSWARQLATTLALASACSQPLSQCCPRVLSCPVPQAYARYKEKRKTRHFGQKIRYQTRKALAESRPRVRGQFVRVPREGERSVWWPTCLHCLPPVGWAWLAWGLAGWRGALRVACPSGLTCACLRCCPPPSPAEAASTGATTTLADGGSSAVQLASKGAAATGAAAAAAQQQLGAGAVAQVQAAAAAAAAAVRAEQRVRPASLPACKLGVTRSAVHCPQSSHSRLACQLTAHHRNAHLPCPPQHQQRAARAAEADEAAEYDGQEEDLGAEEDELSGGAPTRPPRGPAPMDLDPPVQPRRQYAVLLQDESQSATQSFGGSAGGVLRGPRGAALGHSRQVPAMPPARPVADAGAGASTTGPAPLAERDDSPAAGTGTAGTAAWQQLHARLSGHKHLRELREQPAAAPAPSDAAKSGGRNGSDSGSNSPGSGTPVPDSQMAPDGGDAPPPAKQQRSSQL